MRYGDQYGPRNRPRGRGGSYGEHTGRGWDRTRHAAAGQRGMHGGYPGGQSLARREPGEDLGFRVRGHLAGPSASERYGDELRDRWDRGYTGRGYGSDYGYRNGRRGGMMGVDRDARSETGPAGRGDSGRPHAGGRGTDYRDNAASAKYGRDYYRPGPTYGLRGSNFARGGRGG